MDEIISFFSRFPSFGSWLWKIGEIFWIVIFKDLQIFYSYGPVLLLDVQIVRPGLISCVLDTG